MLVGERKPIKEIMEMIEPYERLLVAGCKSCMAVCSTGGEREVAETALLIRMQRKAAKRRIEVIEKTIERQCEPEFVDELAEEIKRVDAVLTLGCGVGTQFLSERYRKIPVFPGVNTMFVGGTKEQGIWTERCRSCGDCMLHITAGICPLTRCSKGLLNGPCGGSVNGKCEIDSELDCAWELIIERLDEKGELERFFGHIIPPRKWNSAGHSGPRNLEREELKEVNEKQ